MVRVIILFLFFFQISLSNATAKDPCNSLPKPNNIFNGMLLETFQKYKDNRLGVGLTYSSNTERFSLFKYDLGYKKIDQQIFKKLLEMSYNEFFKVINLKKEKVIKKYGLIKEKISDLVTFNILFLVNGKSQKLEFLSLGNDGNCVYKARYTTNILDVKQSIKNYKKILTGIKINLQSNNIKNVQVKNTLRNKNLKTLKMNDLHLINEIYYENYTDVPFTGNIFDKDLTQSVVKGKIINGIKEGIWYEYYGCIDVSCNIKGVLASKTPYKNGKVHGLKEEKHTDGKLRSNTYFEYGKKQGSFVQYWHNGVLLEKGNYKNDKKIGLWERYSFSGNLLKKGNYDEIGNAIGVWECYNVDGTPLKARDASQFNKECKTNGIN